MPSRATTLQHEHSVIHVTNVREVRCTRDGLVTLAIETAAAPPAPLIRQHDFTRDDLPQQVPDLAFAASNGPQLLHLPN